jgi:hypothetical protein
MVRVVAVRGASTSPAVAISPPGAAAYRGVYRPRDLSKNGLLKPVRSFEERGCGFGLDHEPLPKLWEVAQLLTHEYRERRRSFEEWGWQPGLLNACSTTWASVLTDVWKPSQSIEYVIVQYLWWKDEAVHRAGMG